MWLELELGADGDDVRVSARGKRGERPPPQTLPPEQGVGALQSFTAKVARAVRGSKALDPAVVNDAQALYGAIFTGEIRDVLVRLGEASKDRRLLVRLFVPDRTLQAVPWEALCKTGTTEGFLGTDPKVLVARGVNSSDPWEPREVRGAIRILAIAPGSDERAVGVLREALAPSIETGEVEWLDPIVGPDINARVLYDRLRRGKSPHIVHFLGHGGVDLQGRPVLRMADDEDGEEVWLPAEALGRELGASFCEELRLVVLEACEGAKAGALGSAAEILAKAGADAVVAHLWPVKADVARTCSSVFYRALAGADRTEGDVGASMADARHTLLSQSAEAFSPVLYLRSTDSVIFNFEGRRVAKPGAKRRSKSLAPALQGLLERPFSLVLSDLADDAAGLQQELMQFMRENGDEPDEGTRLSTLTQHCVLRFGQEILHSLFQQAHAASLTAPPAPPPLIAALGRLVTPGVHITLLWRPYLEHAVASSQPGRTLYTIQPALSGSVKPRILKRAAGTTTWKMEPALPKRFDFDNEIVVLRLYGGYSAEVRPIFSAPVLTEDDHIHGLLRASGLKQPWMEELLARPRSQPSLLVGLSPLDVRHRMLLRWLYDDRPAPKDSLAILTPKADRNEPEIWEAGGGLPGAGRIASIIEDPDQLAPLLDAFEPGAG